MCMTGELLPVELVRAHLNRDGRARNDSGLLELVAKVQPRAGAIHPEALPPEARPTLNSCGRLDVDTQHNWQVGIVLNGALKAPSETLCTRCARVEAKIDLGLHGRSAE